MFAVLPSLDSTSGYVGRGGCGLCGEDLLRGGQGDSCCSDRLQEERELKQDRKGKHRKILAWVARQGSDRQVNIHLKSKKCNLDATCDSDWATGLLWDCIQPFSLQPLHTFALSARLDWFGVWETPAKGLKTKLFFPSMFSHLCTENQNHQIHHFFTTRLSKQGFTYWQQSMFPQYKQHTILDMKHLAGWWRIQGKSVGSRWKQELSRLHRPDIREPAMKRKQPQALLCQFWHLAKFFPILISYLISWRIDLS